jgi:pre-rRNA-processing protein IPI3
MAFCSVSSLWRSGELILAASHGRPIAAYDALTGHVVDELRAANTPRHGLATATVKGTAFVAASHVCPATGAGSIRLLPWCSPAPARELPVPEPVAPVVAAPCGTHLLAGGVSGRAYALALPSGDVARSFRAHGSGAVSCLALSDDGSFLVSGGDDGEVAAFLLLDVLDVEAERSTSTDLAVYRVAAHVAPVTCVACGVGGCNAVVVSASADGTCKVWRLADGSLLRKLALPCTGLSLALDPTSTNFYVGGSDGRVLVASLISSPVTNASSHASDGTSKALIGVAMANEGKNLVSCSEDGEVRLWDLTQGLRLANTFWLGGAVSGVLVVKKVASEVASRGGGDEMFKIGDDVAWTRAREVVEMEKMLRSSEEDKASSVRLLETNINIHKRCLRLMLREVTDVAHSGRLDDGSVSD